MGKSKKRLFNRVSKENSVVLKREEIIKQIIFDIKNKNITETTVKYIDLFGITIEELSENGGAYEELSAIKYLFI